MNYKEWMCQMGRRFNMEEADAELIIANQGIDPSEEVDVTKAKTALCRELALVIPMADVSEGGFSLKWNMEAVRLWYRTATSELGLPDMSAPRLRNRSNIW